MQMHDGSNIWHALLKGPLIIGGSARNEAEPEDDLVAMSDPPGVSKIKTEAAGSARPRCMHPSLFQASS